MNYLVIELQTTNGVTANIVTQYNNLAEAKQKFYLVCSSAVVSSVDIHAVVLTDDCGFVMMNECFKHTTEEETNNET